MGNCSSSCSCHSYSITNDSILPFASLPAMKMCKQGIEDFFEIIPGLGGFGLGDVGYFELYDFQLEMLYFLIGFEMDSSGTVAEVSEIGISRGVQVGWKLRSINKHKVPHAETQFTIRPVLYKALRGEVLWFGFDIGEERYSGAYIYCKQVISFLQERSIGDDRTEDLPKELISFILSFFQVRIICKLSRTCRLFNESREAALKHCRGLDTYRIYTHHLPKLLEVTRQSCHRLTKTNFMKGNAQEVSEIIHSNKFLTDISIGINVSDDIDVLSSIADVLPKLRYFELASPNAIIFLPTQMGRELKFLSIYNKERLEINIFQLRSVLENAVHLETLILRKCLNAVQVLDVLEPLENLETLELRSCGIDLAFFRNVLFVVAPNVRSLCVVGNNRDLIKHIQYCFFEAEPEHELIDWGNNLEFLDY